MAVGEYRRWLIDGYTIKCDAKSLNILLILRPDMPQAPTRVIAEGRVTIPAEIRNDLGLEEGDYVVVDVEPWGDGS